VTGPGASELDEVAGGALDDTDAAVLGRTRALYEELDPVPAGLLDRISFAITLETLDAELATLLNDAAEPEMARGADTDELRSLTFRSESATIAVTITTTGFGARRIEGWVVPAASASVKLVAGSAERVAETDADGHFVFDDVAAGRVAVQITRTGPDANRPIVIPELDL
jgi:hypothetical protein